MPEGYQIISKARAARSVLPGTPMDTKVLWGRYARGEFLTDTEVDCLLGQVSSALPYLEVRAGEPTLTEAREAALRLAKWQAHRKRSKGDTSRRGRLWLILVSTFILTLIAFLAGVYSQI